MIGSTSVRLSSRRSLTNLRAHKIRLNPTPEQEIYFRKAAGTKRFVFNWAIDRWKWAKELRHAQFPQGVVEYGMMTIKKDFNAIKKEAFAWVYDVAKDVAEGAFADAGKALKNYFDWKLRQTQLPTGKRKGVKVGFPRYKSRKNKKQSFRLNNDKFHVDGHTVYIPKLGLVNMAEELRFAGKIMGAVVSKVADWWFISIQVETERVEVEIEQPTIKPFVKQAVGVDVGIKTMAVLSDGQQLENQKPLRNGLNRLRKLSRSLSRRVKGSIRFRKAKRKLARFHYRVECQRKDAQHKASHLIASTYAFIGLENLHVAGMVKNRRLSLSLSDVGLGELIRQIEYKAAWFGSQVVKVGRFFASSKRCSDCGHIYKELTLSERTWTCSLCGVVHDRDWNASTNILNEALKLAYAG